MVFEKGDRVMISDAALINPRIGHWGRRFGTVRKVLDFYQQPAAYYMVLWDGRKHPRPVESQNLMAEDRERPHPTRIYTATEAVQLYDIK